MKEGSTQAVRGGNSREPLMNVGRGTAYKKKHKVIKQQTERMEKLLTKYKGWIFEKDIKINMPMTKSINLKSTH